MRAPKLLVVVMAVLCLAACGDGDALKPGGADTPEALIERANQAVADGDAAELIACVSPDERKMVAVMLGTMPLKLMIGLSEAMARAGGDEAVQKVEKMKSELAALETKYGLDDVEAAMETLAPDTDPSEGMARINAAAGDLDPAAFLTEALALTEKYDEREDGESALGKIAGDVKSIDVDGDTAIAHFTDKDKPTPLVRLDGRWYVSVVAAMRADR